MSRSRVRPCEDVRPIRCEECPVGDAYAHGRGGFCPLVEEKLEPGDVICRVNDPAEQIWVVADGVVHVEDGVGSRVCLPGGLVGVEALHRPRYSATARALTKAKVCRAPATRIFGTEETESAGKGAKKL